MTPDNRQKLRQMLLRDESYRQFPYSDTTGHLTIAIGRNISTRGISLDEALIMLDNDISYFQDKLSHLAPWFLLLDANRQLALVNLCFNVGVQGFLGFREMCAALAQHDYQRAADELLDSNIAPERRSRLANIIRSGELNQ